MADEAQPKSVLKKSEAWLSTITGVGALLTAYVSQVEGAPMWVALGVCLVLTATYAFFRTPLAGTDSPGLKTKAFWTGVVVILASVATALSEADIAGIPAKVTQVAAMVSAAAVALGYNVLRYKAKTKGTP